MQRICRWMALYWMFLCESVRQIHGRSWRGHKKSTVSIQHKYTDQGEQPGEKGFNISVTAFKRCLTSLPPISSPNWKQPESPCTFGWALGLEMLSALLTDGPNGLSSLDSALSRIAFPVNVHKGVRSCPALLRLQGPNCNPDSRNQADFYLKDSSSVACLCQLSHERLVQKSWALSSCGELSSMGMEGVQKPVQFSARTQRHGVRSLFSVNTS